MLLSSLEIISSLALGISDRSRFRCLTMPATHARAHDDAPPSRKRRGEHASLDFPRRPISSDVYRYETLLWIYNPSSLFSFVVVPFPFFSLSLLGSFLASFFCTDFLLAGIFIVLRIWCSFVVTSRSQRYFIRDEWAEQCKSNYIHLRTRNSSG